LNKRSGTIKILIAIFYIALLAFLSLYPSTMYCGALQGLFAIESVGGVGASLAA
jgi:hypothetical protein